jgi:hypothetical protein
MFTIEHGSGRVYAAPEAVKTRIRIVEQTRRRLAEGETRRNLHEAEQEADRAYQLIVKQVAEEVRNAELEHKSAHDASQNATEVMAGFLRSLENAIQILLPPEIV